MAQKKRKRPEREVTISVGKTGKETWRVPAGDRVVRVTTSASSTAIMDRAVLVYSGTMERLAKR
jgi:hypothetical protein